MGRHHAPNLHDTPQLFSTPGGVRRAREHFSEEVKKGRMLGGVGWSKNIVERFLGCRVYVIPCGAVPKNGDPQGRIIHNYSHPTAKHNSVNSALINTSVKYTSFKARVKSLAGVDWYIKADLKNGYRQLPVHPTDWYTQIYSLGVNEYYIDLNMPFGKGNSSKVFCTWSSAWCRSFLHHFQTAYAIPISLSSYVDDFFGGPIRTGSNSNDEIRAKMLLDCLIEFGKITNTLMNIKKCQGLAKRMVILGIFFDSRKKACYVAPPKCVKYTQRLKILLQNKSSSSKDIEKLVGNLVYASWVIPFGRPFISHISHFISRKDETKIVTLDQFALSACEIWLELINRNRGLSFAFISGDLPFQKNEWFIDASSHGFGGFCGYKYFKITLAEFQDVVIREK